MHRLYQLQCYGYISIHKECHRFGQTSFIQAQVQTGFSLVTTDFSYNRIILALKSKFQNILIIFRNYHSKMSLFAVLAKGALSAEFPLKM